MTSRDFKSNIRLAFKKVAITRRQFPRVNEHKPKTFALSVANVEFGVKGQSMLETAYCHRLQNFFELQITSDKDYQTNIEELCVNLGFRPLVKIIIQTALLNDFFNKFCKTKIRPKLEADEPA